MTARALTGDESALLADLADNLNQAQQHYDTLGDALDRDDSRGIAQAHRRLGATITRAQKALGRLAELGAKADAAATETIQTSSGVGASGGTANGRGFVDFIRRKVIEQERAKR